MKAGRLQAWFERMSDRERKIVLGGGATLLVVGMLVGGTLVARRVSALEEQVTANEASLKEIAEAGPSFLRKRQDQQVVEEQLERASKESLQATVLAIAKQIQYDRKDPEGNSVSERLSDTIKFASATEILAELTVKHKRGAKVAKKAKKVAGAKEVFLASIDAVFQGVPDEALLRFMAKLESHPDPLFGIALDVTRSSPSHDSFQATLKIGQFRYGTLEGDE